MSPACGRIFVPKGTVAGMPNHLLRIIRVAIILKIFLTDEPINQSNEKTGIAGIGRNRSIQTAQ
jgi:hypothetical protein